MFVCVTCFSLTINTHIPNEPDSKSTRRSESGATSNIRRINTQDVIFFYELVIKRSDTDLGNTTSAPWGEERATVC